MSDSAPSEDIQAAPTEPLSPRSILAGFRDLGVDEGRQTRLACDPSFNRYTAFWVLGETLDAAYAALEAMQLAQPQAAARLIRAARPTLLSFLAAHYDSHQKLFSTNSSVRTQGIFAFHTAVGVIRLLNFCPPNESLPAEVFDRTIKEMGAKPRLVRQGLTELVAACCKDNAVVENPARPLFPTLTALYTTASVLWYAGELQDEPEIYRYISSSRLERFVDGCIKRQKVGGRVISGFSIHPDHPELCVNTTSFGLRLRQRLGMSWDPELKSEIEDFLLLSYRDGGFSSTLWEPRSLNATYLGLRALQNVLDRRQWDEFMRQNRQSVSTFARECVNPKTGGAPFAPDLSVFKENCLATRYRLQILRLLGESLPSHDTSFEFLCDRYSPATGGFSAYPQSLLGDEFFGLEHLEDFLDSKDQTLHEQHMEKRANPSQPPSYLPDTRMMELYDQLAELGPHEETQRLRLWGELRAQQQEEADRFDAFFERSIMGPLRSGHDRLDELERRLNRK